MLVAGGVTGFYNIGFPIWGLPDLALNDRFYWKAEILLWPREAFSPYLYP